jgi:hypothetical protein
MQNPINKEATFLEVIGALALIGGIAGGGFGFTVAGIVIVLFATSWLDNQGRFWWFIGGGLILVALFFVYAPKLLGH